MYILKWHGYHVVRGNKEGMAPKIPDPSYRGGIFVLVLLVFFVLIFHHYAVPWLPCVIVLMILCSVRPVNITTYWFLAGSVLLAWTTPQPTLGCPGLRLRESIAVLDVVVFSVLYSQLTHNSPTYTQCWDWWLILKSSRHLHTRKTNSHYL